MELIVEVLNGSRKGSRIELSVGQRTATDSIPYVLETEALAFHLVVSEPCESVELLLEGISYRFSCDQKGEFHLYPLKRSSTVYETMFYNYFGVASLALAIKAENEVDVIDVAPFEVLARKLSANQAKSMLDFILDESQGDILHALSATRLSASTLEGNDRPDKLLDQLINDLDILEEILPHIIHHPLTTLTSQLIMQDGAHVDEIQDQGVAWLMGNLSVLQEYDDPDQSHLIYNGTYYRATELNTPVMLEHTNIYENRVIHGYILHLSNFTQNMIDGFNQNVSIQKPNEHDGYVSFFSTLNRRIQKINSHHLTKIYSCQKRLLEYKDIFSRYFPVRQIGELMPKMTPKVKANRHYLLLFRTMIKWYQNNSIDWSANELLLAINGVPKLFEYYTLLRVKRWCTLNGITSSANDSGATWIGVLGKYSIRLRYEPTYWMVGHSVAGEVVNTENRSASASRQDYHGKKRYHPRSNRVPDIVLEVRSEGQPLQLIVLDAKYTSRDLAFERYLPELTMKYVHGLSHMESQSAVNAMIILYPDKDDVFMDFHASPYDVFGGHPQYPALGCQALSMEMVDDINPAGLDRLLHMLIGICSK